ncbi:MAG TPA: GH1 family beta-glucosidase [Terracidiphilus sp.]|jgi:beta-glucosidase
MARINRRQFCKIGAGSATIATCLPKFALSQPRAVPRQFPKGFVWGCSTASYQIEGAVKEDGRGPSIWDTFSHTPGKIVNGDTGDVADDSYHLYKEDIRLLRELGVNGYHFSVAWPRVFPNGTGQPNPKGLDYYHRVIDELLANRITPYIDLYVWDLPQALPNGWQSRDTAKAFADYAGYVTGRLSDRVKHFFTVNECTSFVDIGYREGRHAPGLKLPDRQVNQVRHHALLAHGLGLQAIRANASSGTKVGFIDMPQACVPVIETKEHIEAARRATREENAPFLTAFMEGKYLDSYLEREGPNAPRVEPGDLDAIGSPVDFVGLNVYVPTYVRADGSPRGYAVEPWPTSAPRMESDWLFFDPSVMYWAVRNVCDVWKPSAIYITENGCSSADVVTAEGRVEDTDRVMFLRSYITHLHRAVAEGYPVKGMFVWSVIDNFEWDRGFSERFGLYYIDYKTQKRIPKLSAEWYGEVIAANAVL